MRSGSRRGVDSTWLRWRVLREVNSMGIGGRNRITKMLRGQGSDRVAATAEGIVNGQPAKAVVDRPRLGPGYLISP